MDTKKFQFEMPSNPSFPMKVNPQKTSPALKNKLLKYLRKESKTYLSKRFRIILITKKNLLSVNSSETK